MIEAMLHPLDRVRLWLLRATRPWSGRLAGDLPLRVTTTALTWILLALTLASTVPLWMLALGPIVLGVPHVLSDLRYLVVRRGLHRRKGLVVFAFGPLLAVAAGAGMMGGIAAVAGAVACARASLGKKAVGLLVVAGLGVVVHQAGTTADVVFGHAHNFIAVFLWWMWHPRTKGHGVALVLFLAACAFLFFGGADPIVVATDGLTAEWTGIDAWTMSWSITPMAEPDLAMRLMLVFAFAQSIHYAVWLRLVPDEDRGRPTPRPFATTYRALRADLGLPVLAVAATVALGVAIWAVVDLAEARTGYLRMAIFHGHIELVALALLAMEGRQRFFGFTRRMSRSAARSSR